MKRLLLIAMLCVPLGACTWLASVFGGTPTATTKTTIVEVFADSCHTYAAALNLAAQALTANVLTEAQIATVQQAKAVGDPICNGPQPTNLATAFVSVAEATFNIGNATKGN